MSSIADVLATINKQYGKGTIMKASEAKALELYRIATGVPAIDLSIGGGIPRARITLVKGKYSTCKSLLGLWSAKAFQNTCRICGQARAIVDPFSGEVKDGPCICDNTEPMETAWLDLEGTFNPEWAVSRGVDLNYVHIIRPDSAEQGIDVADLVIRSKQCDLMVIDSVAAMTPQVEVTESVEKQQMGVAARLVNKALRKWTSGLNVGSLQDCMGHPAILLINQVRANIGVSFGAKETTPGGMGQDFFSSIECNMSKTGLIKVDTDKPDPYHAGKKLKKIVGQTMGITTPKNKTFAPHRSATFDFYFEDANGVKAGEVDIIGQYFGLGLAHGIINQTGAHYWVGEEKLAHGAAKAKVALSENPELCKNIWDVVCMKELGYVP